MLFKKVKIVIVSIEGCVAIFFPRQDCLASLTMTKRKLIFQISGFFVTLYKKGIVPKVSF